VVINFVELPEGIVGFGNDEATLVNTSYIERSGIVDGNRCNGEVFKEVQNTQSGRGNAGQLQVELIDLQEIL
jgi:hypothetical protein